MRSLLLIQETTTQRSDKTKNSKYNIFPEIEKNSVLIASAVRQYSDRDNDNVLLGSTSYRL